MPRRAPPPDFRYVWLLPGPTPAAITLLGAIVGVSLFGLCLMTLGPLVIAVVLGCAVLGAAFARQGSKAPVPFGAQQVPMAIVPWGIVVTPDTEPRVLRWPAITRVDVKVAHVLRGGTPAVLSSVVTVRAGRDVLTGRTSGSVGLEGLTANLEAYAEEASRGVAGDLDGSDPIGDGVTEPVIAELVRRARELCASGDGATRLSLPPGGYRDMATPVASPDTVAFLRRTLSEAEGASDPRPLAALVAAMLEARPLVTDLLRLGTSPHPLVAAVAKAAALRLGAPPNKAGALDEVQTFLLPDDYEALTAWLAS